MNAAQKAKLGQKWTCYSCGAKFYDLRKPDPNCPKCGADQRQSPAFEKPKRSRAKKAAAAPAPKKVPKAAQPPPLEEGEDLDTPIDPEDLEFEDIEIDEAGAPGAAAEVSTEIEEPEEEPAADDDDD
jgi:hypothetical protein